ncbi:MAG: hypothetical protein OEM58_11355, partial [Nitrospirota bacterium]|nr:hypothetical protein [Nitrospirota bacterium]
MDSRLLLAGMTEGHRVSMRAGAAGLRSFAGPCPERSRMDQDDNAGNKDGWPMTTVGHNRREDESHFQNLID